MMYISGKGKDEYLTGEVVPPKVGDPKFRLWEIENNIVISWLVNSMTTEIGENFLLYCTAHEILEVGKEFYLSKEKTSAIFEIETTIHDLRQGELSVTQFYNALSHYWQQLDIFQDHKWKCPDCWYRI